MGRQFDGRVPEAETFYGCDQCYWGALWRLLRAGMALSLRVEFPSFVDHLVFNPFCFKVYLLSAIHIPSCSSVTLFVLNSPACFVDHLVFNPFCL